MLQQCGVALGYMIWYNLGGQRRPLLMCNPRALGEFWFVAFVGVVVCVRLDIKSVVVLVVVC